MPAITPRMQVTPTATTYRLLQRISELTGKAPATVTRELLDEAIPALEEMIGALEMLKTRPQQAMRAVDRMLEGAMMGAAQARLDLDKAMQKKPGRKPRKGAPAARAAGPGKKQGRGAANTG